MEIPVYLITGFLDSGKTTLIKESLQDPEFSEDNHKTLIIQFEDGEVSFDEKWLTNHNCTLVSLDSSVYLTLEKMQELTDTFEPKLPILVAPFTIKLLPPVK